MTTAAALAGHRAADAPPCAPEMFRHGMVVTHPDYGVGKIVALGGTGSKRSATVQFVGEPQTRRFRLAYSPLRPAAS
jgi:DNA helicase-2/ATP-dependent DNA helicase PcrA